MLTRLTDSAARSWHHDRSSHAAGDEGEREDAERRRLVIGSNGTPPLAALCSHHSPSNPSNVCVASLSLFWPLLLLLLAPPAGDSGSGEWSLPAVSPLLQLPLPMLLSLKMRRYCA